MCVNNCNEVKNLLESDNNYYLLKDNSFTYTGTSTIYDKCVTSCTSAKPYIDNGECIEQCPNTRRYFIQSDISSKKECLIDCTAEYPYYTKVADTNTKDSYPCTEECSGYYIPNSDPNKISKYCLNACPGTDVDFTQYKYKYEYTKDNKQMKECYINCPDKVKYHLNYDGTTVTDNNCYEECPQTSPYHKKGETICLKQSELVAGYLLYDIKVLDTTLNKCPDEYTLKTLITVGSNTITVCLKECNFEYYDTTNGYISYNYLTPYDTCVNDCSSSTDTNTNTLVSGKI